MPIVKSYKDKRLAELQGLIDLGMHRQGMRYKKDLAKKIRMPEATLSRKYRSPETFSLGEIWMILDVLHIPSEERAKVL